MPDFRKLYLSMLLSNPISHYSCLTPRLGHHLWMLFCICYTKLTEGWPHWGQAPMCMSYIFVLSASANNHFPLFEHAGIPLEFFLAAFTNRGSSSFDYLSPQAQWCDHFVIFPSSFSPSDEMVSSGFFQLLQRLIFIFSIFISVSALWAICTPPLLATLLKNKISWYRKWRIHLFDKFHRLLQF